MVETLLVANNLDRHHFTSFVVSTLKNLAERPLAQNVNHFVAIEDMIVGDEEIVATFVVVAEVVRRIAFARWLLLAVGADKVDLFVVSNFLLLVVCEIARVERNRV